MPPRTPPTPHEIADALSTHLSSGAMNTAYPGRKFIAHHQAVAVVKYRFKTTTAKATDWLADAVLSEEEQVEFTFVSSGGRVGGLLRENKGRWPSVDSEQLTASYVECGYPNAMSGPKIDLAGRVLTVSTRNVPDSYLPHEDECFVVLGSTLREVLQEEIRRQAEDSTVREAEAITKVALAEHHGGASLSMLRGLLERAGVEINTDTLYASAHKRRDKSIRMHAMITLGGEDLERVAQALREVGITPKEA